MKRREQVENGRKKGIFTHIVPMLCALMLFYGFFLGGLQYVIAQVTAQYSLAEAGIGALVAAQHVTAALAPALMGALADRIGKKKILVAFAFVFGAGSLICACAPTIGGYLIGICLIGAGYSVCESLCTAVVSDVDPQKSAQYINLTQCLLSAGAIVAPLIMQGLIKNGVCSWRGLFVICAAAYFAMSAAMLFYRFPAAEKGEKAEKGKILKSPLFLCLLAAIVIYVGLENGFGYFVETLFRTERHSESAGAYGISAYWAGMTLARLLYSIRPYRKGRVVRLSFLCAAAAFILLVLVPQKWLCVAICAAVGVAYAPIWCTVMACATEYFPERKASVAGLMSAGCGAGGIVFPMLTGAVAQSFSVVTAFIMLSGIALIGALLCLCIKKQ